jgi:hypothetical protein
MADVTSAEMSSRSANGASSEREAPGKWNIQIQDAWAARIVWKKQETRAQKILGLGSVGALAGGKLWGGPGLLVGALIGAVIGSELEPE